MLDIVPVDTQEQLHQVRRLFLEYAEYLGFDLEFQGFHEELASLPGEYAPPAGCLLLALVDGQAVGCVALRRISAEICEMKRLYVSGPFRGLGVGRGLATVVMGKAMAAGYSRMRLDTVPQLRESFSLYRSLGFQPIEPYRHNPIPGAIFLEARLLPTP
jgi:putative acetyltransferase